MGYRVLINTRASLHEIHFDPGLGTLMDMTTRSAPGDAMVVAFGGTVLVSDGIQTHAFDRRLDPVPAPLEGGFKAGTLSNRRLYLAREKSICCLDHEWSERGRTELVNGWKDAHDILVVGERAHVLDNIVHPVFVVLLGLESSGRMTTIATEEISDIYPHLVAQFVDAKGLVWGVVQSFAHQGGSGQVLHFLSPATGTRLGEPSLLGVRRGMGRGEGSEEPTPFWRTGGARLWPGRTESGGRGLGVRFDMSSSMLPAWAVVTSEDRENPGRVASLARVTSRGEEVHLEEHTRLWVDDARREISEIGDEEWVFIVSRSSGGDPTDTGEGLWITVVDANAREIVVQMEAPIKGGKEETPKSIAANKAPLWMGDDAWAF